MDPTFAPAPNRHLLWKIVQFPLTRLVLALVFVGVCSLGVSILAEALAGVTGLGELASDAIGTLLLVLVVHGAYRLYVRLIERRRADELSLEGAVSGLAYGIVIGAVFFSCVIGAIWAFGCFRVIDTNPWSVVVPVLIVAVSSGYVEEVIARGIIFRIVEDGLGTWISLVFSAALFGVLHAGNPNATAMSSISISLTAGIMLAAAYMLTRKLWIAIGIHFAWNFTQGGIYGVAISGFEVEGVMVSELSGPTLIAGGAFGAEASIFALVFGVPVGLILLILASRRHRIVAPFWKRKRLAMQSPTETHSTTNDD